MDIQRIFNADNKLVVLIFDDYSGEIGYLKVKKYETGIAPDLFLLPFDNDKVDIGNELDDERLMSEYSKKINFNILKNIIVIPTRKK